MKKLILTICFLILSPMLALQACAKMERFHVNAQRNAVDHSNRGVIYMQDRYYAAAIKEFQLAILLDPDTQAAATYYANLANCYMKIGYPALAQDALQRAIKLNPMNLTYYEDLTITLKRQKLLEQKLKYYKKDAEKNPLSHLMVGFILIEQGNEDAGIAKLHEFVATEPDLIISKGVQKFIDERSHEKF